MDNKDSKHSNHGKYSFGVVFEFCVKTIVQYLNYKNKQKRNRNFNQIFILLKKSNKGKQRKRTKNLAHQIREEFFCVQSVNNVRVNKNIDMITCIIFIMNNCHVNVYCPQESQT